MSNVVQRLTNLRKEYTKKSLNLCYLKKKISQSCDAHGIIVNEELHEAALAAMELESYLHPCKPMTVGFLPMSQNTAPATTDEDDGTASSIAAVQIKTDPALEAIKELVERLDRLEGLVSGGQKSESKKWNARKRDSIVCWNCGGKGHVARECATLKQHEQQENFLPSVQRAKHERGPRGPLN